MNVLNPNVFKSPEWLTKVAVDLIDCKLGSFAIDLAQILQTKKPILFKQLADLYLAVINKCIEHYNISITFNEMDMYDLDFSLFDPEFPSHHPIYKILQTKAKIAIEESIGTESVVDVERPLYQQFVSEFIPFLYKNIKVFPDAAEYISILKKNYSTDEGEINRHTNEILNNVECAPLPIDASLTLSKIYVTPITQFLKISQIDDPLKSMRFGESLIESILITISENCLPIIIHGQPGHGKTSSVKMLIPAILNDYSTKQDLKPPIILFYDFKSLNKLEDNEISVLSKRSPFLKSESFFYDHHTILIIDGMDEIQVSDISDTSLKIFLRNIFDLSITINKRENSKFNLILTGRTQYVNEIRSYFSADYYLFQIMDFNYKQISYWLSKYCDAKSISPPLTTKNLAEYHLQDLITQPILLTISSIMLTDINCSIVNEELNKTHHSRTDIYRLIIRWSFFRKWNHNTNLKVLDKENVYIAFLRAIAIIMLREGKEQIKFTVLWEQINQNIERFQLDGINTQLKDYSFFENLCKKIAVSFFFTGIEDNTFSFIHKSIKDYLVADGIYSFVSIVISFFNPQRPESSNKNIAEDLYFIFGKIHISIEDHMPFLNDIISLFKSETILIFRTLLPFFQNAISHSFMLQNSKNENNNPLEIEANFLSGIFHFLTSIFNEIDADERKLLSDDGYLHIFLSNDDLYKFVSFFNACGYTFFLKQNFLMSHLYLSNFLLVGTDLSGTDISYSDLSSIDLSKSNFCNTNICCSNLSNAIINDSDFTKANLKKVDLTKCSFSESNLSGSTLKDAIVNCTKITSSILKSCVFNESTIIDSDFSNSDLTKSEIKIAKITNSNFAHACLVKASLNYSTITGSDFSDTNCRGAVFLQSELNDVNFNSSNLNDVNFFRSKLIKVKFTRCLLRSVSFHDAEIKFSDFRGSDLQDGNLRNANFSGTDLRFTQIVNANLDGTNFENADLRNITFKNVDFSLVKSFYKAKLNPAKLKKLKNQFPEKFKKME